MRSERSRAGGRATRGCGVGRYVRRGETRLLTRGSDSAQLQNAPEALRSSASLFFMCVFVAHWSHRRDHSRKRGAAPQHLDPRLRSCVLSALSVDHSECKLAQLNRPRGAAKQRLIRYLIREQWRARPRSLICHPRGAAQKRLPHPNTSTAPEALLSSASPAASPSRAYSRRTRSSRTWPS